MALPPRRAGGLKRTSSAFAGVFLRGLGVILPMALTAAVLAWFVTATEHWLGKILRAIWPDLPEWPGLGIALAIALIFGVGLLVSARIAQVLIAQADALLASIPIVKTIYVSIRDVAALVSGESKKGFGRVVAVQLDGLWLIGFVTTEEPKGLPAKTARDDLIGVYLPMSYGIGGYTVYLPKERVEPLDISLEDAMRITMSGGVSEAAGGKEAGKQSGA